MRVETKKVYYCDFCKKKGLRSVAKHEARCTNNPDRECYWLKESASWSDSSPHVKAGELRSDVEWIKTQPELTKAVIEELRDRTDGCPACMLSVLRLSTFDAYDWHRQGLFDYTKEIETFNLEQQRKDEYASIY